MKINSRPAAGSNPASTARVNAMQIGRDGGAQAHHLRLSSLYLPRTF